MELLNKLLELIDPKSILGTLVILGVAGIAALFWLAREAVRLRKELALVHQEEAKIPESHKRPKRRLTEAGELGLTVLTAVIVYRVARAWTVGLDFSREHFMLTAFSEVGGFLVYYVMGYASIVAVYDREMPPLFMAFIVAILFLFGTHLLTQYVSLMVK